ncbi:MAG: hypothetical protein U5K56_17065 [Halioglobus sp.]|nr:hypothetical protein [Halioglobus sp.]
MRDLAADISGDETDYGSGQAVTNDIPLQPFDVVIVPKTTIASISDALNAYVYDVLPMLRNISLGFNYPIGTTKIEQDTTVTNQTSDTHRPGRGSGIKVNDMRIGMFLGSVGSDSGGPERYETELVRHLAAIDKTNEYELLTLFQKGPERLVQQENFRVRALTPSARSVSTLTTLPLWDGTRTCRGVACDLCPSALFAGTLFVHARMLQHDRAPRAVSNRCTAAPDCAHPAGYRQIREDRVLYQSIFGRLCVNGTV